MSSWPGKYVIGLTGNIATGKSVVRKMLEHLGAFGIDADGLSHQAMSKGGPAYAQVAQTFGQFIIGADGQIDRQALGNIAFTNPKALAQLETIIHPFVRQAVNILAGRAGQRVIVIEAIKLLEGELAPLCDSIWVVNASDDVRVNRLTQKRGLTAEQAKQRLAAQSSQKEKIARATAVIENDGSYEATWTQVQAAWARLVESPEEEARESAMAAAPIPAIAQPGEMLNITVRRGQPADGAAIAAFITAASKNTRQLERADVMAAFGQKAYLLAQVNSGIGALAGWQVENLVARVDDFYLLDDIPADLVLGPLIDSIEAASRELQSEAAFLFVPPAVHKSAAAVFNVAGFEAVDPATIGIAAWREAAKESQPPGTVALFKKLREDRVLRPV
ncbi:MAG TPA: dephospho-CoA kinase [Anaerolineales bacterium]|nr:dephospho-CoA kinase [Anaerolineales bacterium]